jgi:flagellar biosynthesis protein FlhB
MNKQTRLITTLLTLAILLNSTFITLIAVAVCFVVLNNIVEYKELLTAKWICKDLYKLNSIKGVKVYLSKTIPNAASAGIDFIIIGRETPKAVLYHELAHVLNNDIDTKQNIRLVTITTLLLLTITAIFVNIPIVIPFILTITFELFMLKLNRKQEYRADAYATNFLSKKEIGLALVDMLGANDVRGFEFFQTHPKLSSRLKAISKL